MEKNFKNIKNRYNTENKKRLNYQRKIEKKKENYSKLTGPFQTKTYNTASIKADNEIQQWKNEMKKLRPSINKIQIEMNQKISEVKKKENELLKLTSQIGSDVILGTKPNNLVLSHKEK